MRRTLGKISAFMMALMLAAVLVAPAAVSSDRDDNPPGPRGGHGTNWENPPGPEGGPGASPDRKGHRKHGRAEKWWRRFWKKKWR